MYKRIKSLSSLGKELLFLLCCFFLITSCGVSSLIVNIQSARDESAPFDRYKTYNWYQPNPAQASKRMGVYNDQLHNNIRRAVEEELEKKGYRKDPSSPQVLVAYDVAIPNPAGADASDVSSDFGYSYAYLVGYRYDYGRNKIEGYKPVTSHKKGTLILDFIDAQQRELVWRGYAENVITDFNSSYDNIENYVDDILDKLPKK